MDDKFFESLTEEESAQLQADVQASQAKILQQRQEKAQAGLRASYEAEIKQLAQTLRGESKIYAIAQLKAAYRGKGLQVW